MDNSKLQLEIINNVKDLREEKIHEVLDFILFLKHMQKSNSYNFMQKDIERDWGLLLEFGEGLFDGSGLPNDTASNHDKYLYGNR